MDRQCRRLLLFESIWCPTYMHVFSKERSKLDAMFTWCIFLGYPKGVKRFKLYDTKANKVVISRNVIFDEKSMLQSI